jgi:hypothetical protein
MDILIKPREFVEKYLIAASNFLLMALERGEERVSNNFC